MNASVRYEIKIKSSAEKEMNALPLRVFTNISNVMLTLESTPRPHGCKKLRGREEYRMRVGNYRILYSVNDKARIVEIVAVGDRKEVYR